MFSSILFPGGKKDHKKSYSEDFYKDLGIDGIIKDIKEAEKDYSTEKYYYIPLRNKDDVIYRQDILKDLENEGLRQSAEIFSENILAVHNEMKDLKLDIVSDDDIHNNFLQRGHIFDCAGRYIENTENLYGVFSENPHNSRGIKEFSEFLEGYIASAPYGKFRNTYISLRKKFSESCYCMLIRNGKIRVRKFEGEEDLSSKVIKNFERFRQGDVKDYRKAIEDKPMSTHVEAEILKLLSDIYPDEFALLLDFVDRYVNFENKKVIAAAREIRFYLSWLSYTDAIKKCGLSFTYPEIADEKKFYGDNFFDIGLAKEIVDRTVTNSFYLEKNENIIVVTGPNQGGKTTFARAFGQLHYFTSLGLSVPGTSARLKLTDRILTHFERGEDARMRGGMLENDLLRLGKILKDADENSLIVINEIFSSTTLEDALKLGGKMMEELNAAGPVTVLVTFMDELCSYDGAVSMMSTVNGDERTYKIIRKPPDGLAHAMYIAGRHGLTYSQLSGRLKK